MISLLRTAPTWAQCILVLVVLFALVYLAICLLALAFPVQVWTKDHVADAIAISSLRRA
jgi:hypothetical protein